MCGYDRPLCTPAGRARTDVNASGQTCRRCLLCATAAKALCIGAANTGSKHPAKKAKVCRGAPCRGRAHTADTGRTCALQVTCQVALGQSPLHALPRLAVSTHEHSVISLACQRRTRERLLAERLGRTVSRRGARRRGSHGLRGPRGQRARVPRKHARRRAELAAPAQQVRQQDRLRLVAQAAPAAWRQVGLRAPLAAEPDQLPGRSTVVVQCSGCM